MARRRPQRPTVDVRAALWADIARFEDYKRRLAASGGYTDAEPVADDGRPLFRDAGDLPGEAADYGFGPDDRIAVLADGTVVPGGRRDRRTAGGSTRNERA